MSRPLLSESALDARIRFPPNPAPSRAAVEPFDPSVGLLIRCCQLRPEDRVLVVGPFILGHILALAGRCAGVTGMRSSRFVRPGETREIVWFTDVADPDNEVISVLKSLGTPRLIIIELIAPALPQVPAAILDKLEKTGFLFQRHYRLRDRVVLVGHRRR